MADYRTYNPMDSLQQDLKEDFVPNLMEDSTHNKGQKQQNLKSGFTQRIGSRIPANQIKEEENENDQLVQMRFVSDQYATPTPMDDQSHLLSAVRKVQTFNIFKEIIMKQTPKLDIDTSNILSKKSVIVDLIVPELKKPKGESELKPYFPEINKREDYVQMQNLFFFTSFSAEELSKYTEQSKVILGYMENYILFFQTIEYNREIFINEFKNLEQLIDDQKQMIFKLNYSFSKKVSFHDFEYYFKIFYKITIPQIREIAKSIQNLDIIKLKIQKLEQLPIPENSWCDKNSLEQGIFQKLFTITIVQHEYRYIYPEYEFETFFREFFEFTKEKYGSLQSAVNQMEAAKPNVQELRNDKQFLAKFNAFLELFKKLNQFLKNELTQKTYQIRRLVEKDCTEIKKRIDTMLSDDIKEGQYNSESWSVVVFFREVVKSEHLIKDMCDFLEFNVNELSQCIQHIDACIMNKSMWVDVTFFNWPDDQAKETQVKQLQTIFPNFKKGVSKNIQTLRNLIIELNKISTDKLVQIKEDYKKFDLIQQSYFENLKTKIFYKIKEQVKIKQIELQEATQFFKSVIELNLEEIVKNKIEPFYEKLTSELIQIQAKTSIEKVKEFSKANKTNQLNQLGKVIEEILIWQDKQSLYLLNQGSNQFKKNFIWLKTNLKILNYPVTYKTLLRWKKFRR